MVCKNLLQIVELSDAESSCFVLLVAVIVLFYCKGGGLGEELVESADFGRIGPDREDSSLFTSFLSVFTKKH